MSKNDNSNANTDSNSPEARLEKLEALIDKISKTDSAFSARFSELMKFNSSLSDTEKQLKNQATLNQEELNKVDKGLKLCEQSVSRLTTEVTKLEKSVSTNQKSVSDSMIRLEKPLSETNLGQTSLSNGFNRIERAFNQDSKLKTFMIWGYRGALAVIAIFFVYCYFSLRQEISSINEKLDNLSEKHIETKQSQGDLDKQIVPDNKPKANKNK